MKVTLINPPWLFPGELDRLGQNSGLGYIASFLRKESGAEITIIDALAEGYEQCRPFPGRPGIFQYGLGYEEIAGRVAPGSEVIGITCPYTYHQAIMAGLIPVIRGRFPGARIVLGGVLPSTLPEKALDLGADYIVMGEGEKPFADLCRGGDPAGIPGIGYVKDGEKSVSRERNVIRDLDTLPFPARDLLPFDRYLNVSARGKKNLRAVSIYTARGCPFDCNFCSVHKVYGYRWRKRRPENVLEEIEQCVRDYDIGHIEFEDDNLTLDPERAYRIFDGISELNRGRRDKLTWSAPSGFRIDTLDEKLLLKMKESGCVKISLALENGDPEMLEMMNKKLDLGKVEEVVRICRKLDIKTLVYYIVGYPGETEERFQRGLKFIRKLKRLGADNFAVYIAKAHPGTNLEDLCRERGYLTVDEIDERILVDDYTNFSTPECGWEDAQRRQRTIDAEMNPPHPLVRAVKSVMPSGTYHRLKGSRLARLVKRGILN